MINKMFTTLGIVEINKIYINADVKSEYRTSLPPLPVSQPFIDRIVIELEKDNILTIDDLVIRAGMARGITIRVTNFLKTINAVGISTKKDKRKRIRTVIFNKYTRSKKSIDKEIAINEKNRIREEIKLKRKLKKDKKNKIKKDINDEYNKGVSTIKSLAAKYDINITYIYRIINIKSNCLCPT